MILILRMIQNAGTDQNKQYVQHGHHLPVCIKQDPDGRLALSGIEFGTEGHIQNGNHGGKQPAKQQRREKTGSFHFFAFREHAHLMPPVCRLSVSIRERKESSRLSVGNP